MDIAEALNGPADQLSNKVGDRVSQSFTNLNDALRGVVSSEESRSVVASILTLAAEAGRVADSSEDLLNLRELTDAVERVANK